MKTIYVGFSRNANSAPGSKVIQLFLNKPFSHTYFKFKEDSYCDHTIFHAVGKGLTYISETNFLNHNTVVFEKAIEINDETYKELLNECHQNAGRKYGFLQNLGILWVRSLNCLGFDLKTNPLDDGINCSEWMYYLLEEIYGRWTDTEPNLVAPDEVYNYLINK